MVYIKRAITIALGLVVAFNILANYAFGESVASEPSLLREEHTREPTMVINVDGLGSTRGIVRNDVVEFMGLPYAKPPTGQLRWKAPILQDEPWDGVYDANRYVICVQPPYTFGGFHPVEMIEDCLRLNIWAPKELLETKPSERKLWPVIVYMHGGMFAFGSGVDRYINGTAFIKEKAILVSINYRLGLFGFLAHPQLSRDDPQNPTNFGFLDQRVALNWIQKYISSFGGDPNMVTLWGESAGASSVMVHLSARGFDKRPRLFHRAILQSAVPWVPTLPMHEAQQDGRRIARQVGCMFMDTARELECMRKVPATQLKAGNSRFLFFHAIPDIVAGLVDDGVNFYPSMTPFLSGNFDHDVPIMIGSVRDEGTLFAYIPFALHPPSPEWYEHMVKSAFYPFQSPSSPTLVDSILHQYHLENFTSMNQEATVAALSEIIGDTYFTCPAQQLLRAIVRAKKAAGRKADDAFAYVALHSSVNTTVPYLGVFHGSELPFFFNTTPGDFWPTYYTKAEQRYANAMIKGVVSFAYTGSPSHTDLPWPAFDMDQEMHLTLQPDNFTAVPKYKEDVCGFWKARFPRGIPVIRIDILTDEPLISVFMNDHVVRIATFIHANQWVLPAAATGFALIVASIWWCCCRRSSRMLPFKINPPKKTNRRRSEGEVDARSRPTREWLQR